MNLTILSSHVGPPNCEECGSALFSHCISEVSPRPFSFYNQLTIVVDFHSYLSYTALITQFVAVEFSKCGPNRSWEICFWQVLTVTYQKLLKTPGVKPFRALLAKWDVLLWNLFWQANLGTWNSFLEKPFHSII